MVGGRAVRHVERVDAQHRDVQREFAQYGVRERADQLVGLRAGDAAGDHDLHLRTDRQFVGDVERVGDDRQGPTRPALGPLDQVGADRQGPRDLGGGGAAVQTDHLAGGDQGGGGRADPLLGAGMPGGLVPQRQVVRDVVRDGAAPGAGHHLLAGQFVEVAADGGGRDVQRLGGLLDVQPALLGQQLQQCVPPLVPGHAPPPLLRPVRATGCAPRAGARGGPSLAHSPTRGDPRPAGAGRAG